MADEYPPLQRLGDAVLLQGVALADTYFLVTAGLKHCRTKQTKLPPRMLTLQDELESAVRLHSQAKRQGDVAKLPVPHTHCIGTDEAAALLGMSRRQVQRIAKSLDGQLSGTGAWEFDRRTVKAYGAARAA